MMIEIKGIRNIYPDCLDTAVLLFLNHSNGSEWSSAWRLDRNVQTLRDQPSKLILQAKEAIQ